MINQLTHNHVKLTFKLIQPQEIVNMSVLVSLINNSWRLNVKFYILKKSFYINFKILRLNIVI